MSSSKISTSCWSVPSVEPLSLNILKFYKYSPLAIEASILSSEKRADESGKTLRTRLKSNNSSSENCKTIDDFIEKRKSFLLSLVVEPKVKIFARQINAKAEEIRKNQQEISRALRAVKADEEIQKEIAKESKLPLSTHDFLIDVIRAEVLNGKKHMRQDVVDYLNSFEQTLQKLLTNGADVDTVYGILSADVEYFASNSELLHTTLGLAVPLDLSPLRLPLCLIEDTDVYDHSRRYYPPVFVFYNPKSSSVTLSRPYRTIDGHPILIRAPAFYFDKNQAQRETSDARENFSRQVGPLLYSLKGWSGTQEIAPSFIVGPIVEVIKSYLSHNPMSIDLLKILDLGCGTGSLLKRVIRKVQEEPNSVKPNAFCVFLNDDSQVTPGRAIHELSTDERYFGIVESKTSKGDMRNLILDLSQNDQKFDIVFMNRVLDMYGGYGLFDFKISSQTSKNFCSSYTALLKPSEPNVGDMLVFSESACHEKAWRAISYVSGKKTTPETGLLHLPAIDVKMKKNFFIFNNEDTLEKLLSYCKLLVISMYPGSFKSVFPEINPERDHTYYCQMASSTSYSVICLSHDEALIESIKSGSGNFKSDE
jgi:hypothetical protein